MNMVIFNKKYLAIAIAAITVLLIFQIRTETPAPISIPTNTSQKYFQDVSFVNLIDIDSTNMLENIKQTRPIFFIETRNVFQNTSKMHLNPRQACAVESTAKANIQSTIYVLFATMATHAEFHSDNITKALLEYRNIIFFKINFDTYRKGTPIENWDRLVNLQKSPYVVSHASDVLRFVTMYKYGGIYFDLDVVITKPWEDMKPNYVVAESNSDIGSVVLNFDRENFGHWLIGKIIADVRDSYKGGEWAYNGPGALTRMLQKICKTKKTTEMNREKCQSFEVFPNNILYPVHWTKWELYFKQRTSQTVMETIKNSKGIHLWNKLSSKRKVFIDSQQPYNLIAKQFCPRVYKRIDTSF